MNAAYLSALFSQAVGTPFRSYLAVFRLAFKQATGLRPKSWRETMQGAWS
jgi:AraC-like DNA-binding protein